MTATDWQGTAVGRAEHAAGYAHRRAIEGSARRWGRALGVAWLVLLARRLREVDVDRDGARHTHATAWRLVETWAHEGPQTAAHLRARARVTP